MILNYFKIILIFILFIPIINNPKILLNIIDQWTIFSYFIFGKEDMSILSFGINYKNIDLNSLIQIQETWWVIFCILNIFLIILFSKKSFLSFDNLRKKFIFEEIKQNKIFFFFLLLIILSTIHDTFYASKDYGFYSRVNFDCWDLDLKIKLDQLSFIRKMISSFYFFIILVMYCFDKNKSTFIKLSTWYILWFIIRSMDISSGIIFDVTTLLFMKSIVEIDLLNNTLSFFSYFPNAFSIEENKEIIKKTQINPCQAHIDKMEQCRGNLPDGVLKTFISSFLPCENIVKDIDHKYSVGNCVVHHQQNYDSCMQEFKNKKKKK